MAGEFIDQEFEKYVASDDEHEIRDEDHGKLLQAVQLMDSQLRIKPPTRTEPSSNISEFDLAPVKGGGVHLKDLARSLETKGKAFDAEVATKIRKLTKTSTTLQKPLEKIHQIKIKRVVGYNNLTKHVARWDAAVQTNRAARTISFPMNIEPVIVRNASEVAAMWQSQTPTDFEAGLNALRGMSKVYQEDKKAEEKFRLSLAELRQKRQEMAKLRAQQSYEAAKARRQSKIKSKSYHRILRREKMQKQLKEFETLQKTDPAAALKRLEELERVRAEERMTLRHKNTGHWARSRLIRAKYDPQTRQELAEQLSVSRELTKKLKPDDSSDDEQIRDTKEPTKAIPGDEENPWITVKSSSEINEFVSGYRKYWDERHKKDQVAKENPEGTIIDDERMNNGVTDDANLSDRINELPKKESAEMAKQLENGDPFENSQLEEQNIVGSNGGEHSTHCSLQTVHENELLSPSKEKMNSVLDSDNESAEYEESKEIPISMDISEDATIIDQTEDVSHGKLKKKHDRKSKHKKTTKSIVKSTSNSWIVTPISGPDSRICPENQVSVTPRKGTTDSRVKMFLASLVPEVLQKEEQEKKKKKKKSALDKMFNEVETKISLKLQDKLKILKSHFGSESGSSLHPEIEESLERKNDRENDLGASLALRSSREARPSEDTELLEGRFDRNAGSSVNVGELVKTASGLISGETGSVPLGKGSGAGGANIADVATTGATSKTAEVNINPEKFIAAKPKMLLSAAPELTNAGEEALDDEMEEDQQQIITEAFADDNVVDDFRKEKEEDIKKSQPGEIDLSLPGWGDWGGAGIEQNKKKKKSRFVIKPPPAPPRQDADKSNVIINEEKVVGIREHQVSELPAPFLSVKDFEASIRAPIGSTWIPETAHKRLIAPAVITKIGTVIKPMDDEFLVNKKALVDFST